MIDYKKWYEYLTGEVTNGSIYLWGGQGETLSILTDEYINKKETSSSNAKRVIALRNKRVGAGKIDLKAFDCSGLGVYKLLFEKAISSDMTAHGIYNKCEKITLSKLKPGDFVFRLYTSGSSKGHAYHIGYVVDDLTVIHAKGRDVGVVHETLNQNGANYWNAYGRSPWVENIKPEYEYVFTKNMKKGMKGTDIKNLQALLLDNNFNCGSIDGVFGSNTLKAVKACQKASKLKVDGIAGKNTIKALGGIWKA
jgi:hypothetical protein